MRRDIFNLLQTFNVYFTICLLTEEGDSTLHDITANFTTDLFSNSYKISRCFTITRYIYNYNYALLSVTLIVIHTNVHININMQKSIFPNFMHVYACVCGGG